jgi:RNA recognition motif-containing protein
MIALTQMSEQELQRLFAPYGCITEIQLHRRGDGASKGSAVVAFSTVAEGANAFTQLVNHVPLGATKPIIIKPSTGPKKKEPRNRSCNVLSAPPAPPLPPSPPAQQSSPQPPPLPNSHPSIGDIGYPPTIDADRNPQSKGGGEL